MSSKRNFKPTNNNNDTYYRPSIIGKVAIAIALPATFAGFIALIVGMVVSKWSGNCLAVGIIAEIIAVLAGVVIVVDIIIFNNKNKKDIQKNRQASNLGKSTGKETKEEKDIMDLVRFVAGFGIGLLLGYLLWGIK